MQRPEDVLQEYITAVYTKDVERLLSLYSPDLEIFDMWARFNIDSIDEWKESIQDWFGSLAKGEKVAVRFFKVQSRQGSDSACISAFVEYKAVDDSGQTIRQMHNRISLFLIKQSAKWQIVHQHTSAPLNDQLMAILTSE